MLRWQAKLICGVIMFVDMPICFLLPVKMTGVFKRWGARGQYVLDLLTCFAGGVFLASYLVFMAPAVRVLIEENLMKDNGIEYPLPDMIIGLGFFGMLMLDKLVKTLSNLTKLKSTSTSSDNAAKSNGIHRSDDDAARATVDKVSSDVVLDAFELNRMDNHDDVKESQVASQDDDDDDEVFSNNISVLYSPSQANTSRRLSRAETAALSRHQSVLDAAGDSTESMTRSIVMMLALSIDSVLEGMAIGLKQNVVEVWAIFVGIIVHESVIAFCLGLQLVRLHHRLLPVLVASLVYTLMNPIGLVIATAVYETMETDRRVELANGILQALTAGCFIYVIFYEILEGQINQETPFSKIVATFVGYVFLASFAAIPGSSAYGHGDSRASAAAAWEMKNVSVATIGPIE